MTPAIPLVDDETCLLALTAELQPGPGCCVATARNGGEALAIIEQGHAADLLVTAVQMPGLRGFELESLAKALGPTLALLHCTAHPEMISKQLGAAPGPVLTKPYATMRLPQAIQWLQ